jgi:DNA repair protein RecO (recombination protein O)
VVCPTCEANSFPLSAEAHEFMVEALGRPMSEARQAEAGAVRQAGRAIGETLEHHAHVRLPRPEEKTAA